MCQQFVKSKKPEIITGPWTREEDFIIENWVKTNGPTNWVKLVKYIPHRVAKQCRARWFYHLSNDTNKQPWTEAEDYQLITLHNTFGNHWDKIAIRMSDRSEHACKNRFESVLKRRKHTQKKRKIDSRLRNSTKSASEDTIPLISFNEDLFKRQNFPIMVNKDAIWTYKYGSQTQGIFEPTGEILCKDGPFDRGHKKGLDYDRLAQKLNLYMDGVQEEDKEKELAEAENALRLIHGTKEYFEPQPERYNRSKEADSSAKFNDNITRNALKANKKVFNQVWKYF